MSGGRVHDLFDVIGGFVGIEAGLNAHEVIILEIVLKCQTKPVVVLVGTRVDSRLVFYIMLASEVIGQILVSSHFAVMFVVVAVGHFEARTTIIVVEVQRVVSFQRFECLRNVHTRITAAQVAFCDDFHYSVHARGGVSERRRGVDVYAVDVVGRQCRNFVIIAFHSVYQQLHIVLAAKIKGIVRKHRNVWYFVQCLVWASVVLHYANR